MKKLSIKNLLLNQKGFWRIWHHTPTVDVLPLPLHSHIILENGFNLLLEDGGLINLEP